MSALNRLVEMATHPYTFSIESLIGGYHDYGSIWNNPIVSEELICERELGKSHDPYVAVKKAFCGEMKIGGEMKVVGYVPRNISAICSLFITTGGIIRCEVKGNRRYLADLPQGGLKIPCVLHFKIFQSTLSI